MYVKYPRTPHLPWSKGNTEDDVFTTDGEIDNFKSMDSVIVTEKMDGENTTLYSDYIHARAIQGADHPSRSWVKALHAKIKHEIPTGWRICGENLYAKHSIYYSNLSSYFMVFSIFDEMNNVISWSDTVQISDLLGLITVPVLYSGPWDTKSIRSLDKNIESGSFEGYVIRNAASFPYSDFATNVAKFVRPNHVQTSTHWKSEIIVPNKLKND